MANCSTHLRYSLIDRADLPQFILVGHIICTFIYCSFSFIRVYLLLWEVFASDGCVVAFVCLYVSVCVSECRWTFRGSWSFSKNEQRLHSSCSRFSALACGVSTSTGTTAYSRSSCSWHSKLRWSSSSSETWRKYVRWEISRTWFRFFVCYDCSLLNIYLLRLGCYTRDREVLCSTASCCVLCNDPRQVIHIRVPLSPSSRLIVWYWPKGGDSLWLG